MGLVISKSLQLRRKDYIELVKLVENMWLVTLDAYCVSWRSKNIGKPYEEKLLVWN